MRTTLPILVLAVGLAACSKWRSKQSQATDVPPKFTPEEAAESRSLLAREGQRPKIDSLRSIGFALLRRTVSEFVRLFPNAEVNYRYFTSTDEPGFDLGVDLYERYELRMQLPVRFDPERQTVVGYGEPMFSIWEAASITRGPAGKAETTLNPAGERHFGSAEWRTLVEHGGDFRAIGYTMITNQPVPGFTYRKVQP